MVYLIQGFFFQNRQWLGLDMSTEGEGVIAVVRQGLCRNLFSGVMFPDTLGGLIGEMNDRCGESELSKVVISSNSFQFEKNYKERVNRPISYSFRRKGLLWIGEYSGETVGRGGATCITTEVSDNNLFYPPDIIPA